MAISISTPQDQLLQVRDRFKRQRLSLGLTQEGLAQRSGVSLGSLKRFESSGQIAFESLLRLAWILDCLKDFNNILETKNPYEGLTLDQLLARKKTKKRGHLK